VVGVAAVDGLAGVEARLGGDWVGEVGAGLAGIGGRAGAERLHHAAVVKDGEGRVEEEGEGGGGLLQQEAVGEGFQRAAAEGKDEIALPERGGEGEGLKPAEMGLAVGGEDGGDREAGAGFDGGVEIEEVPAEALGEQAADGGLAGAHEAGEDKAADVLGRHGADGLGWSGFGGRDGHWKLL